MSCIVFLFSFPIVIPIPLLLGKGIYTRKKKEWRFYANEKTSISKLAEPLVEASIEGIEAYCEAYALMLRLSSAQVVHDWSSLNYTAQRESR